MTIRKYQERVDKWIKHIGIKYYGQLTNMAILTEEVGEVSRLIARIYGEQSFKNEISREDTMIKLGDELADVFFVLTCLANQCEIDLESVINNNIDKKSDRDKERHLFNNS